jgi:hypothetical protein
MADLKPMELGEILDGALTMYRRHFGLLLRLAVMALWLPVSVNIYLQLTGGPLQHTVLYFFTALFQYFAGLFLTAGAIRIISDSYLGRPATIGPAVALGMSKILPLFGVALGKTILLGLIMALVGVVAAVSIPAGAAGGSGVAVLLALVVAGLGIWLFIFVACGYAVTTQVVVLEPLDGAFDSFGRSWELTRGLKAKVAGVAVVAGLIFFVPTMALGGYAGILQQTNALWGQILSAFLALLPIVLSPILACVFTVLYYDLRIRREGFDLQVLGQSLGLT